MYDPSKIEPKWQKYWLENKTFKAEVDTKKEKYYVLDMFPYPSGSGLHVGHPEGYTATDIICRFKRMQGLNVLHPMGWDAFGLPAENYAIKTKVHPKETIKKSVEVFKGQIQSIGFSYDWDREINTSSPEYYKWTQWFFLFLYKNGLAYKKEAPVNWCESCKTVLANEQVLDGNCERCENEVIQKELSQWFFKITDFIEDNARPDRYGRGKTDGLLTGLKKIDWPHGTLTSQENWIGKSHGADVEFGIRNSESVIRVYTTRPDTLFGATYMVLSPEHPFVDKLVTDEYKDKVDKYKEFTAKKSDLERTDLNKDKTGEFTGAYAINPVNNEEIPIWVADYVLMGYGTGAIMCVPAHDTRDWEFAKKFDIPMIEVIKGGNIEKEAYVDDGELINSEFLNGMDVKQSISKIISWLEEKKIGKGTVNYKLRDWSVSRQRYWGTPIPIIHCEHCGEVPVPEEDLPIELPDDVDFMPTGESPLHFSKTFHDVKCPKCGKSAKREADTMDTFVCSSWYMYRFTDPQNNKEFAAKEAMKNWCPVDLYIGGAEHTVMHLLYARFIAKALHKHGYIDFDEPFSKLRHQGMILGEDGEKMSKSRGNVINPDDVIRKYGADTLRIYEMFMGPFEAVKPWSTQSIEGSFRFLQKVWRIAEEGDIIDEWPNDELVKLLHKTIKKVGEDIENFRFNTAISQMMILANEVQKLKTVSKPMMEGFAKILSPFAPHLCEEIWEKLGHKETIAYEPWPEFDAKLVVDDTFELVFSVNGKVRGKKEVAIGISEEDAIASALEDEGVKRNIEGKEIIKKIYVSNKLVNIVVK